MLILVACCLNLVESILLYLVSLQSLYLIGKKLQDSENLLLGYFQFVA